MAPWRFPSIVITPQSKALNHLASGLCRRVKMNLGNISLQIEIICLISSGCYLCIVKLWLHRCGPLSLSLQQQLVSLGLHPPTVGGRLKAELGGCRHHCTGHSGCVRTVRGRAYTAAHTAWMEFLERPLCAVPPGPARCLRGSDAPQVLTYEFQGGIELGARRPRGVGSTTDQTSIQLVTVCLVKGAAGEIQGTTWKLGRNNGSSLPDQYLLTFAPLDSQTSSPFDSWTRGNSSEVSENLNICNCCKFRFYPGLFLSDTSEDSWRCTKS